MTDPLKEFENECKSRIESYSANTELKNAANHFNLESNIAKYSYNFSWLGRPIIQYPQDMVMMQEIIWSIKPDLIIETGIAHGGSLIFYASILDLIGKGIVVGVDIDIRKHNFDEIVKHPMYKRIKMIQGSSIDLQVVNQIKEIASDKKKVLVCLDSNHTHEHVLEELKIYSELVSIGSYIVVFDTIVEDLPNDYLPGRPWKKGDNPKPAVFEFLKTHSNFSIDNDIDNKLLISVAPQGYLKRIS